MKEIFLQAGKKNPPLMLEVADSFFTRFRGLCFMRFAIDAVYIDRDYRILKVVTHLRPWLGLSWCPGAWGVIELPAGAAQQYGLQPGQVLQAIDTGSSF